MVQLSQDDRRNAGMILGETGGWVICLVITRGRYEQYAEAALTRPDKCRVLLTGSIPDASYFNVRDYLLFSQ